MAEIDHVVVLMLENRSFDSMLGRLYPDRSDFAGLKGNETNVVNGKKIRVWTSGGIQEPSFTIPDPDPGESFDDITAQIFGAGNAPPSPATMEGFATNYASIPNATAKDIMHGYSPDQVPVLSTLAQSFGVSDDWFASAPNQTWPNRFFVHTGTASGYVNNMPLHVPYLMETIYNRLSAANRSWRVYFHDMPQVATLSRIWADLPDHLYSFEEHFMADAMAGRLPSYSFIEPRYFSDPLLSRMPNDQHPPHDITYGERLIARCYDAIRNGAAWTRTLFIITYDEHGGLYDHVPPPDAVPPDDLASDGFKFDRYGVRVPAVLISPWIPAGSVVRPPEGSTYPFDHTSIIATVRKLFGITEPLTKRDAVAPDLLHALSLQEPSNVGPANLTVPGTAPRAEEVKAVHQQNANHMQMALSQFADHLPSGSANVLGHLDADGAEQLEDDAEKAGSTVGATLDRAKKGLTRFLQGEGISNL
ncbi:alkaline phosphatase family protein [Solirhodobacter olei]|uniref:alkaline phosphatase family protein n=1 Tax=Solirhodobacter olei TaxID=2493082 RepID=UPI000FDC5970|nr:alkaline phosphatase family protein [Solirhodobacter olei]